MHISHDLSIPENPILILCEGLIPLASKRCFISSFSRNGAIAATEKTKETAGKISKKFLLSFISRRFSAELQSAKIAVRRIMTERVGIIFICEPVSAVLAESLILAFIKSPK